MRKSLLCLVVFIFSINMIFAENLAIFENRSAYTRAELANTKGDLNPANIGFRNEKSLNFNTYVLYHDEYEPTFDSSIFHNPKTTIAAVFYGQNLSLSFKTENYLLNRDIGADRISYTGVLRYLLQLDWGYRYDNISLGMRLKGGSELERSNFSIRTNLLAIPDYIINSFFSRYDTRLDTQFFSFGFGLVYQPSTNISFAITTDSNIGKPKEELDYSNFLYYLKDISLGLSYISDKYSYLDELNLFRYKFSSSLLNIGDTEYREVNFSNEFIFQLSRNFVASFLFGLYEQKTSFIDIFSLNSHKAKTFYGLSFNWKNYGLYLSTNIPVSIYLGKNNENDNIGVSLKFSYSS